VSDQHPEENRRALPRARVVRRANYSVAVTGPPSDARPPIYSYLGTGNSLDMSGSGCRLQTSEPIPPGTRLNLQLQFGEAIVSFSGWVVRSEPTRRLRWYGALGAAAHSLGGAYETAVRFEVTPRERDQLQVAISMSCAPAQPTRCAA
jgi:hypothetical protein